jgi:tetratricopeptide (TPR) repeat protein
LKKTKVSGSIFIFVGKVKTRVVQRSQDEGFNIFFTDAAALLQKAINIYTEDGRFSTAAKYEKDLGEMYETEGDLENAIKHYQKAADYYEGEGSSTYELCPFFLSSLHFSKC